MGWEVICCVNAFDSEHGCFIRKEYIWGDADETRPENEAARCQKRQSNYGRERGTRDVHVPVVW